MNFAKLKEPFPAEDIEWRIQRSGFGKNTGKPYAMVLAYITNRAIMDRLDEVCGPENWQNEFRPSPAGDGVLCGISIRIAETHWVTKWDGAENTQFEAIKGGLSSSMKRAAVQWGIGRYLYNLEAGFAIFDEHGKYKDKIEDKDAGRAEWLKWNPPALPSWAIPMPGKKMQEAVLAANTTPAPNPAEVAVARLKETAQQSGKMPAGEAKEQDLY